MPGARGEVAAYQPSCRDFHHWNPAHTSPPTTAIVMIHGNRHRKMLMAHERASIAPRMRRQVCHSQWAIPLGESGITTTHRSVPVPVSSWSWSWLWLLGSLAVVQAARR